MFVQLMNSLFLSKAPSNLQLPLKVCKTFQQKSLFHTSFQLEGSFFNERSADVLWKTNTSVSTQGRIRGRAKGLIKMKNLNRGQKLGIGKSRILWPGLSQHILGPDRRKATRKMLSEADFKDYEESITTFRSSTASRVGLRKKQTALERGWAGQNPQGKSFGKPKALNESMNFDDFDSVLVEQKVINSLDSRGRVRSVSMMMLTGNKNGLAGFALTRTSSTMGPKRFQKAVNKAGVRLCYIDLYEGRTVYHDMFTQFGATKIFIRQRPPGFGVKGHRVIKAACKVIGIKDLQAVIEGANNYNHIVKAFFLALLRQRTHADLANEKKLHLLELRAENDFYPRLVASPSEGKVRTKEEIDPNEALDFELIALEGNLPFHKLSTAKFWEREPGWELHLKKNLKRNHLPEQRIQMLADYGRICSHLSDDYPECVPVSTNHFLKRRAEQKKR